MATQSSHPKEVPAEQQEKNPGEEHKMKMKPQYDAPWYKGSDKLLDQVAIITGGDSGIGRAVAVLFAREGADVVISYLNEDKDALETKSSVEKEGRKALLVRSDLRTKQNCLELINKTINHFGRLDILVNNAGEQYVHEDIREITDDELMSTFQTKFFSMFWLSQAALEHLKENSCIINTASINAYKGHPMLLDYTAANGAIISFTRALALQLAPKKIRVNAVAPGPIWTPLIPSTFPKEKVENFGKDYPLGRPGQPEEVSPSYVFLASKNSSYFTGQTLHPNGGQVING